MAKFVCRAYSIDYFEDEIDAANEEEAKAIFEKKLMQGDIDSIDGETFLEGEEGYEMTDSIMSATTAFSKDSS